MRFRIAAPFVGGVAALAIAMVSAPAVAVNNPWLAPGQVATLNSKVKLGCPGTEQGFQEMYDAITANDQPGYEQAVEHTGGTWFQPGQQIHFLAMGSGSHIRIRIVKGPDAGLACWTDEQMISPYLKNIRSDQ